MAATDRLRSAMPDTCVRRIPCDTLCSRYCGKVGGIAITYGLLDTSRMSEPKKVLRNGLCRGQTRRSSRVLPAHAGMVPRRLTASRAWTGAPRARGDGPDGLPGTTAQSKCSPRTRGWSPARPLARLGPLRAPRARGDGPSIEPRAALEQSCSPRTRGWSPALGMDGAPEGVLPAHAGMVPAAIRVRRCASCAPRARGDGPMRRAGGRSWVPCSPRTRGWSLDQLIEAHILNVLPAHAGMVPATGPWSAAGCCAPRARGDGPRQLRQTQPQLVCSPRTRGWSQADLFGVGVEAVLPAHAGMVPRSTAPGSWARGAPRARGDGPWSAAWPPVKSMCSPRTRGWSHVRPA